MEKGSRSSSPTGGGQAGLSLTSLIAHPEQLDRDTLYELRSMLAIYPYFQTARLLLLQNLYLLHDPTFDEELRRAAIYITDRRVIFSMIEAAHYKRSPILTSPCGGGTQPHPHDGKSNTSPTEGDREGATSRTVALIDSFLDTLPKDDPNQNTAPTGGGREGAARKPTPADAAVDYVAYLLETQSEAEAADDAPQLKGHTLIDTFIEQDNGKIVLSETPQFTPQIDDSGDDKGHDGEESYFTETLARIYIKQGRYDKALEIIQRLSLNVQKKNAYFADQIRFLQKLIINNKTK